MTFLSKERRPADYAFEVPCFNGWNLTAKAKSKDMSTIQEPYSYITSISRTPVLYFKDKERLHNIELTRKLIEGLSNNYETEKEINKRLINDKIWSPVPFDDQKIDNNLSHDEIRNEIFKKGHKQVKFNSAYLWRDVNVEQITKYLYNYKIPPQTEWTSKIMRNKLER